MKVDWLRSVNSC
uniref:Uncharacterized protein n=1 Tax=Anguilla anguilla TaxID=7936 RepID=A0A0E9UCE5_ANGAN